MSNTVKTPKIAIIGLGYVGLPLAVAFAEKYSVVGFDINKPRIMELNSGIDHTLEIEADDLKKVLKESPTDQLGLFCTDDKSVLTACNVFVVTGGGVS